MSASIFEPTAAASTARSASLSIAANPTNARLGRRSRQRVALTHEGWYYLALVAFALFGALFRELNLLMLLAGMLAGPLVFNALVALCRLRHLQTTRCLPDSAFAGEVFAVEIEVSNPRRRAVWGLLIEDAVRLRTEPNQAASDAAGAATNSPRGGDSSRPKAWRFAPRAHGASVGAISLPRIDGRATMRSSYQARLNRRGKYVFGPLTLSSHFPLGLVRRWLRIADTQTLFVYPRLGTLSRGLMRWDQEVERGEDRLRQRQGNLDGEFYGLRSWRSGDGRQKIHWRSSARAAELMVRQFERQRSQDILLIVDPWLPREATSEAVTQVELAFSCAATILVEAARHGGCQISLQVTGPSGAQRQGGASPGFLREALETLAVAEPHCDTEGPMRVPLVGNAQRTIVCVTTRANAAFNGQASAKRVIVLSVGSREFAESFHWTSSE